MRGDANHAMVSVWMKRFGALREVVRTSLANDMNTREMVNAVQGELRELSKAILENKAGVPYEVTKEELAYMKQLMTDLGFRFEATQEEASLSGALMDTFCEFRRDVRACCLKGLKEENAEVCKEVLQRCDAVRQVVSSKHHCSIIDGKGETLWVKGELPKKEKKEAKKDPRQLTPACPPSEMFKLTGEFSQFDASGFPLLDKEGKPLSPTKQKKLRKRMEKHRAIHQKWLEQQSHWGVCYTRFVLL